MRSIPLEIGFTWDGKIVPSLQSPRILLMPEWKGLRIYVEAPFHNDPAPPNEPGSTEGLWNYEVVELFLVGGSKYGKPTPYLEIEMGPHGHYLALELLGERNRIKTFSTLTYHSQIQDKKWNGEIFLPRSILPDPILRYNAFSISGIPNTRTYLCMSPYPTDKPDFHKIERFPKWIL